LPRQSFLKQAGSCCVFRHDLYQPAIPQSRTDGHWRHFNHCEKYLFFSNLFSQPASQKNAAGKSDGVNVIL